MERLIKKMGKIYINGVLAYTTLERALQLAGPKGVIGIKGVVRTKPLGYFTDPISDITIYGMDENAEIRLNRFHFKDIRNQIDLLTIKGEDVIISNLKLNAGFKVDFALRFMHGSKNCSVVNVVAQGGTRGAINVLTPGPLIFNSVTARRSIQGGFYFDACGDCSNLIFHKCETEKNWRTGILLRNTYGDTTDLDLSGITVREGHIGIEDRKEGMLGNEKKRGLIVLKQGPIINGWIVRMNTAKFVLNLDSPKYSHFRYREPIKHFYRAKINSNRHGVPVTMLYVCKFLAKWDKREGEEII